MKRRIILISGLSLLFLGVFSVYKQNKKANTLELIKIDHTLFVLTEQPSSIENTEKELGPITKKIDRFSTPDENFESNSLPVGSLIFSTKDQSDLPKIVIYEKNDKLYLATEKDTRN